MEDEVVNDGRVNERIKKERKEAKRNASKKIGTDRTSTVLLDTLATPRRPLLLLLEY